MAKLAEITSEIRIVLKILGIAATIVVMLFLVLRGGEIFKNLFFPTPTAPPEEKFGRLPEVSFPNQNPVNLIYRINTITGKLPLTGNLSGQFPDRMKVYRVNRAEPSLVALVEVRNRLSGVGFSQNETKVSESVYRFSDSTGTTIIYDLITNNFKISSNIFASPPQKLVGDTATAEGATRQAINLAESIGEDTSDIDPDLTQTTYLKVQNGALIEATSQNDAQLIRVDLFQKALDNTTIYYPALKESPMYFIFKNESGFPATVEVGFVHYTANLSEKSDYSIKSAAAAFEDLKRGNAFVFNENKQTGPIDITEVSPGYYINANDPQYFVPIIVFSGSGFTAYVNALASP